jgi:hypothetical protein
MRTAVVHFEPPRNGGLTTFLVAPIGRNAQGMDLHVSHALHFLRPP